MDVLQIKMMSALVHAEEYFDQLEKIPPDANALDFDLNTFRSLMSDPDIVEARESLEAQAFLPVKRD